MRSLREFLGTTTLSPRAKTFCLRLMAAVLLFALGYFCKDFERSLETRKLLARGDSGDEYRGIRLKGVHCHPRREYCRAATSL